MDPIRVFNRYVSQRHLTVFAGELLLISGSMAFILHRYSPDDDLSTAVWKGSVVSGLCLLCLYYNDLYDLTVVRTSREAESTPRGRSGAASQCSSSHCSRR